mgnify:CR=1 FL=1
MFIKKSEIFVSKEKQEVQFFVSSFKIAENSCPIKHIFLFLSIKPRNSRQNNRFFVCFTRTFSVTNE